MKKIFSMFLAMAMTFLLVSCGGETSDNYDADDREDAASDVVHSDSEADETVQAETVLALDPDAYFGIEGAPTDDGLTYYVGSDSHDYADVYACEVLCDEYGFTFTALDDSNDYLEWQLGYGDDSSETVIWVTAYDDSIVVNWDEDIVQWVTPKGYETSVNLSYEDGEDEIQAEDIVDSAGVPPAMDAVFSFLTLDSDDGFDDNGNAYMTYNGCSSTDETIETIEEYIDVLAEYGYSLLSSEKRASSYYVYYLECSDSDIEQFTYRSQKCQLALEGFSNDSYGWHTIYVYYSPSIVGMYRSVDAVSGGSSSSSSSSLAGSSSSSSSGVTVKCIKCHGSGEITCPTCNGMGHKETYVTVPNYSGHSSTTTGASKQTCNKCGGSGTITCTRCGGSGTE